MGNKLGRDFYNRNDVCLVARELLGKTLISLNEGKWTVGKIVETEAYNGRTDKACHAYPNLKTKRTLTMYQQGGTAYVYLCYGIHKLFNVVTNQPGMADAVLIRGVEPLEGIDVMMERRKMVTLKHNLTAGPGCLTQAMGISLQHNGLDLLGDQVFIEDVKEEIAPDLIKEGPRVGVAYAEEDALLPWRYSIKGNPWVSKANPHYSSQP